MTPGLALFYGGMVRAKSVLNMMMMSFGALALISVLWVLYGYSIAFGDDVGAGLLGDPTQYLGLEGLMEDTTSEEGGDRKSTRLNSSHANISYAVFCLKKKITYSLSSHFASHLL